MIREIRVNGLPPLTDSGGRLIVIPNGSDNTLGDGVNNVISQPTTISGARIYAPTFPFAFNGTTWDRARNNNAFAVLPSAARSASPSATFKSYNARGLVLALTVTANPGGAETLALRVTGSVNGAGLYTVHQTAASSFGGGAGATLLTVMPGAGAAWASGFVTEVASKAIPDSVTVQVIHSAGGTWTYRVDAIALV